MKDTGIIRRVDVLGRVVIPREIRKILNINDGDPLEIYTSADEIILKKYSAVERKDFVAADVAESLNKVTAHTAIICDRDVILAASGAGAKELTAKTVSKKLGKFMSENKSMMVNVSDGVQPFEISEGNDHGFCNQFFLPITDEQGVIGGVLLADKNKDALITSLDISLCKLSAEILSARR